ncbi:hypothetical protein LTR91_011930 [Friedmanniomyces endolithicus]|uniref:Uncharacterized protein n=1 Tax=Friedmanniomyces endolithicus TaxID=329885 RepID=A0AAN6QQU2_9PEZI|nr:hypothetical protein LTR94_015020 [Friedmanniomyces endolithicus]KAK0871757.1 hypothetical protein LTR87_012752 [Friedmanniomyces endolithicus]KAK0896426.1 hypothetical protein LTR02_011248 [Friedmanniomyces endolithicus]KAK0962512.1 hypothetical protein LTS01_019803 [Friedmanniomyces endolithicus]KAK0981349.1 hypothetical protein LTR91_011930 [Friedmanniomyces endolithicus]
MRDPEAMHVEQLEILKQQIDSPAGHVDFSKGLKIIGLPPSLDTYRDATRYAHIRYLKCCESLNRLYDDIRRMRRQALLNKAMATGSALRMAELSALKMNRISGLPDLKIGDESWIQGVPKGYLQREVAKAVLARRTLDEERNRLLPMSEEAAAAEQASRKDDA